MQNNNYYVIYQVPNSSYSKYAVEKPQFVIESSTLKNSGLLNMLLSKELMIAVKHQLQNMKKMKNAIEVAIEKIKYV